MPRSRITSDEVIIALNARLDALEKAVREALAVITSAGAAHAARGPRGPAGPPGPQGEAGATPDLTALTNDVQARLDRLEDLERQMRTRVHQVADESEARVQRAITQVNLLTRKGSDQ